MSMKRFLVIILICIEATVAISLVKRRLEQFADMIKLKTGRRPHDFNNYGGWCGRGGAGIPVDHIDGCCKTHDLCYRRVWADECKSFMYLKMPYLTYYQYETQDQQITCTNDRDEEPCERTVCECDRQAAECFERHVHKYSDEHKSKSKVTQIMDKTIQKLLDTPEKLNQWKDVMNNVAWDMIFG